MFYFGAFSVREARMLMKQTFTLIRNKGGSGGDLDLLKMEELCYLNMVNILLLGKMGEIEEANMQCLEMLSEHPNSFEVNYLGALYYHHYARDQDKADRFYRTAISIEAEWAKTYFDYALLFKQNKDAAQFLKYLKIAFTKNPAIPRIKEMYHKFYDEEGRIRHQAVF